MALPRMSEMLSWTLDGAEIWFRCQLLFLIENLVVVQEIQEPLHAYEHGLGEQGQCQEVQGNVQVGHVGYQMNQHEKHKQKFSNPRKLILVAMDMTMKCEAVLK